MNFATYGPFKLQSPDWPTIDAWYEEVRSAHPKLDKGIGIYIVSCRDSKGKLIPWYVGRTHKGLGNRLYEHFQEGKFTKLIDKHGSIEIFLLPRVTGKGQMIKATEKIKADGLKSIKHLEFILIGACLTENGELLNKQESTFHTSMHVPGFWNSSVENYDNAAKQLALMLKMKFGHQE